jgi:hypothetical protein
VRLIVFIDKGGQQEAKEKDREDKKNGPGLQKKFLSDNETA